VVKLASNAGHPPDLQQNGRVGLFDELRQRYRHRNDTLVCRDVVELVTDYLEGAMSADDRRAFEHHLSLCEDCTAYVEQCRRTVDVLGRVQPEPPDDATRTALLDAFRDFHADGPTGDD
jgi:anti-sigma-K factor RskA